MKRTIIIGLVSAVVLLVIFERRPLWEAIYLDERVGEEGLGHRVVYHVVRWGQHKGERHGSIRRFDRSGTLLMSGGFKYDQWHGVSTTWERDKIVRQTRFEEGVDVERRFEPPWWPDGAGPS